jgi:1-acyl-sn-glycerol-3-phosphate acyltransferase
MLYWVLKGLLKPPLLGMYDLKTEDLKHVPKKGAAIIAANHLSFLDSFFIPLVVKRRKVTYLAKADYFKSWKTSWFFKGAGQISCERAGGSKSEQSLQIALDVLKGGNLLGIYPEGTRSPDGRLYRGRTGVARLALAAGVPVIPCGLVGTEAVMPKEAKLPRFRGQLPVRVRFGKPLDFSRFQDRQTDRFVLRSVTDEIVYEIMQLSGQGYVDEYASRTATVPLPEATRSLDEVVDLSDDILAS